MKKTSYISMLVIGGLTVGAAYALDVPPGKTRMDTVGFAKDILASRPSSVPSVDASALKNPFNPAEPPPPATGGTGPSQEPVAGPEPAVQLSDIAPKITPSGAVQIGGESILLFGQKKFKVGDHLPIIFEGKSYELDIVDIQNTSFTLRLNGVEITRPIKSVSKP